MQPDTSDLLLDRQGLMREHRRMLDPYEERITRALFEPFAGRHLTEGRSGSNHCRHQTECHGHTRLWVGQRKDHPQRGGSRKEFGPDGDN